MQVTITPSTVSGSLMIPASKSLSHRALICAGLASGTSTIRHLGHSRDIQATMDCLKALGAVFHQKEEALLVDGCTPSLIDHPVVLDAYESGSTLRFFIPIAATSAAPVTFHGQPTLLSRPMGIYANIFLEQHLPFEQSGEAISFHGPLQGGLYTIDGNVSSQFISGLLMAGPLLSGIELAVLPPYQSRSYVDLTTSMMEKFGIQIEQPTSEAYRIHPGQSYKPTDIFVESDWSQAAFFLVLGLLNHSLTLQGLNPDSLQGDEVILDLVKKAGAKVEWDNGNLVVSPDQRKPLTIDLANCPDLGPILCVMAAYTPGTTRIEHAARLRYKECDRIAAMEEELKKWGVEISSDEDSITIVGKSSWKKEEPVIIDSHNDHRIAMAMAIFGCCADSPCVIENAQAINKSYPDFFEDLKSLHGKVDIQ